MALDSPQSDVRTEIPNGITTRTISPALMARKQVPPLTWRRTCAVIDVNASVVVVVASTPAGLTGGRCAAAATAPTADAAPSAAPGLAPRWPPLGGRGPIRPCRRPVMVTGSEGSGRRYRIGVVMKPSCSCCGAELIVRKSITVRGVRRRRANGKSFAWCPNGCKRQ